MVMDLRIGDVLRLRRRHPCGSIDWDVVRLGADIGLECKKCRHKVLIDRPTLQRRVLSVIERGAPVDPAIEQALFGTTSNEGDAASDESDD
ncbi:MAG: DUF951 domain-containing protein [Chloroflexi bacterium]|nr:MAG: DUF951 domain-containing protein [Chloroflexota bacterium]